MYKTLVVLISYIIGNIWVKTILSPIIPPSLTILWDNSKFWKEKVGRVEFYYFAYVRNIINKLFNLWKGAYCFFVHGGIGISKLKLVKVYL